MFYFLIDEKTKMIEIKNLVVSAKDKKILNWINLDFEIWKNYCLLWKNWSGKSTLSSVLMWSPKYRVDSWTICISSSLENEKIDLLSLSPDERSAYWIFLSFQNVPEISWIKLSEYLRTIYNIHLANKRQKKDTGTNLKVPVTKLSPFLFKRFIKKYLEELHIDEKFLDRDLNVGFSGWEKRKIEILQMKLIWPKYIILDEIDSGLDLDAFKKVAELLKSINSKNNSLIIITHYFKILDYIDVDEVYILKNWELLKHGWKELIEKVKKDGYE